MFSCFRNAARDVAPNVAPQAARNNIPGACQICNRPMQERNQISRINACRHDFHIDCLQNHYIQGCDDNFHMRCPNRGCNITISLNEIKVIAQEFTRQVQMRDPQRQANNAENLEEYNVHDSYIHTLISIISQKRDHLTVENKANLYYELSVHSEPNENILLFNGPFSKIDLGVIALEHELSSRTRENIPRYAAHLLTLIPEDWPELRVNGVYYPIENIREWAEERNLPRVGMNQVQNIEREALLFEQNLRVNDRQNVHGNAARVQGNAIIDRLKRIVTQPITLEETRTQLNEIIQRRATNPNLFITGMNVCLANDTAIENLQNMKVNDSLRYVLTYVNAITNPDIKNNVTVALLRELREIGLIEGLCAIGQIQRIIGAAVGIDPQFTLDNIPIEEIRNEIERLAQYCNEKVDQNYHTDPNDAAANPEVVQVNLNNLKREVLKAHSFEELSVKQGWPRAIIEERINNYWPEGAIIF